jgi:DNA polymerase V
MSNWVMSILAQFSPVQKGSPQQSLMDTMDKIKIRFGRGTLKISSDVVRRACEMRADNKSPTYTTDWEQIAQCR